MTLASDHIWALVCGFPGPQRRKRLLLVLHAYIDGSGSNPGEPLSLAGYISTTEKWAALADDWQALREAELDGRPLKMKRLAKSVRGLRKAEKFYRLIECHAEAAISCTVWPHDLANAVNKTQWPPYAGYLRELKNAYYACVLGIIEGLAKTQEKLGLHQPVDFIFDDQSEASRVMAVWENLQQYASPEIRKYLGNKPIFRKDDCVQPLQAADLYAWWVRHWSKNKIDDGVTNLKFAWGNNINIPRIDMRFSEEDLIARFKHAITIKNAERMPVLYPVTYAKPFRG